MAKTRKIYEYRDVLDRVCYACNGLKWNTYLNEICGTCKGAGGKYKRKKVLVREEVIS